MQMAYLANIPPEGGNSPMLLPLHTAIDIQSLSTPPWSHLSRAPNSVRHLCLRILAIVAGDV